MQMWKSCVWKICQQCKTNQLQVCKEMHASSSRPICKTGLLKLLAQYWRVMGLREKKANTVRSEKQRTEKRMRVRSVCKNPGLNEPWPKTELGKDNLLPTSLHLFQQYWTEHIQGFFPPNIWIHKTPISKLRTHFPPGLASAPSSVPR